MDAALNYFLDEKTQTNSGNFGNNAPMSKVCTTTHQTPSSLIQSMMGSIIPKRRLDNQSMVLHSDTESCKLLPYSPCKQPNHHTPDSITLTTQLFELFGNEFPPLHAFEPTPIREKTWTPAVLDSSLLESVLQASLDVPYQEPHSIVADATDACELFQFFEDQLIVPSTVQNNSEAFATALDSALVTVRMTTQEANCFSNIGMIPPHHHNAPTSGPTPKTRRLSNDDTRPSIRRYQEVQWMEQFQELVKFKDQNGHCLVPHNYPKNQGLSRWVRRNRYQYKLKMAGKTSTITDARIEKLEDIGFVWDSHAAGWDHRLQELKQYRDQHGDCNVPSSYPKNPALATWIKVQRRQYKLYWECSRKPSSMTLDRMKTLNELGFIWDVRGKRCFPHSSIAEEMSH